MPSTSLRVTRSCPQPPDVVLLLEWCIIAGHWISSDHRGSERVIDESVMIYCVNGGGDLHLRQEHHVIRAGDLFLCPPLVPHYYSSRPDTGWDIWWCHFGGAHAEALCRAVGLSAAAPLMRPGTPERVVSRFSDLLQRLEVQDDTVAIDASGLVHRLLLELFRQAEACPPLGSLAQFADDTSRSVDEMARQAGYSKYHFCRLFKAQTGRTPWQYVLDRKIERAKELLIGTRLSIKEISASLQFDNPDYFARLFRSRCGVAPRQYRGS